MSKDGKHFTNGRLNMLLID